MKGKLLTLGFVLLLVPLLAGCALTGSGNVVTQEFALSGFDKVDVSNGFQVDISQGDTFSVVIRVDDNRLEYLEVVKEGSALKIGLKPGGAYVIGEATLEAEVAMPELAGLNLTGGSHCNITGFKSTKTLDADLSGGSHLRGDIEAGDASFDLSGGSHVTLSGSGQDVSITASGGSHIKLADFAVTDADVQASGGSHTTVSSSGRLDAVAKGGSHVRYLGAPTLGTIDRDGSSSVKQQ